MPYEILPPVDEASPATGRYEILPPQAGPSKEDVQRAMLLRQATPGIAGGTMGPDLVFGARQVFDKLRQVLAHAPGRPDATAPAVDAAVNENKADYEKNYQPGVFPGSGVAQGLGQAAMVAPLVPAMGPGLLPAIGGGMVGGAVVGASDPVYGDTSNFWSDTAKQAGKSAAMGAGLGAAGTIAGKVIGGAVMGPAQQMLHDEGVRMTAGQIAGGAAKTSEDKLMSSPLIGDLIGKRRFDGVTDFNRVVYARAVEPLAAFDPAAANVAAKADVGNNGIRAVGDYLSSKYDEALSKSVPAPYDNTINDALDKLATMVPSSKRADFTDVLKREVFDRFTPESTITPSVAKTADSELGRMANEYKSSSVADERVYASALRQAQYELRDLFARNNPDTAPMIQAANEGWATLVQMERAANYAGARKDGIFTPAQYLAAVSGGGGSVRNRAMARGEKMNQDLAQAAAQVLPSQVNDSGTTARLLTNAIAGEGLRGAGMLFDPHTLATAATAALPYMPVIGPALTSLAMVARPQAARSAGGVLRQLAPYLGLTAGASLQP